MPAVYRGALHAPAIRFLQGIRPPVCCATFLAGSIVAILGETVAHCPDSGPAVLGRAFASAASGARETPTLTQ